MQLVLYDLRKNKNKMTQQEVADYLGIAVQTYRAKEKGIYEFTQDEMFALSELFDKNLNEIFLPRKYQNGNKQPS
ncbi:helix-turn-helix transcriptional regulator [Facklamia sp. P12934]|uniref:helix-turn-helix transcriptional regulator n=1 Tax=Facklamia sp. P12934 TaxID=3421948 RepID=UPI003D174EDE